MRHEISLCNFINNHRNTQEINHHQGIPVCSCMWSSKHNRLRNIFFLFGEIYLLTFNILSDRYNRMWGLFVSDEGREGKVWPNKADKWGLNILRIRHIQHNLCKWANGHMIQASAKIQLRSTIDQPHPTVPFLDAFGGLSRRPYWWGIWTNFQKEWFRDGIIEIGEWVDIFSPTNQSRWILRTQRQWFLFFYYLLPRFCKDLALHMYSLWKKRL